MKKINDSFFVGTLDQVKINDKVAGYVMVTEQANDILIAVEEKKFYNKNSLSCSSSNINFFFVFK